MGSQPSGASASGVVDAEHGEKVFRWFDTIDDDVRPLADNPFAGAIYLSTPSDVGSDLQQRNRFSDIAQNSGGRSGIIRCDETVNLVQMAQRGCRKPDPHSPKRAHTAAISCSLTNSIVPASMARSVASICVTCSGVSR